MIISLNGEKHEERPLKVALDAIDRADMMDTATDAHTRALAASIRSAVTGWLRWLSR